MTPSFLPTFIIGGAPRSGTTYLAEALARHPEVHLATPIIPEPKVFIGPPQTLETYRDRYRALFELTADVPPRRARGEKTSGYLERPHLGPLIQAVIPDVRLLFIVREPVARAYSNYLWSKKNGLETLSFEEAIEREGDRPDPLAATKPHARPFAYLERSDYGDFAAAWLRQFGADRVLFVLYEDIDARPAWLLDRIQDFIEVDRLPFECLDVGRVNSAREIGPPIEEAMRQLLREKFRGSVERFGVLTGLDLTSWAY